MVSDGKWQPVQAGKFYPAGAGKGEKTFANDLA